MLGFGAEGNQGILLECMTAKTGFVGIDAPEFFPVENQVIGQKALRVGQKQLIQCALGRVEV